MKIVGIIQARMSSTRLPGKVLLETMGRPMILLMLERVARCKLMDSIWLATSDDKSDDQLASVVERAGYNVFRGSLENVLSRFWHIGKREKANAIVRLTGDCPLHDPEVIDSVINHFLNNKDNVYYVSNVQPPTYPDGLDTEVFYYSVLDEAHKKTTSVHDIEHVVPYIRRKVADSGRKSNFYGPADFSHLRWTLDEPEDYDFINNVYQDLYPYHKDFTWLDVIAWLTKYPEMIALNSIHKRNEGLKKKSNV
ncbi:MAG: glycosyltransferase family protein [Thermodesulfobacteriota bacterium]|nr:glycosyltransferase family protein [Thermodesulfobacteriota bacterium]